MNPNGQSRTPSRLGEGPTALARLCLIVGMCSIFIVMLASAVPESAKDVMFWIQRSIVSAAILILLGLFFKYPLPSRRPQGLTEVLIFSTALFLATWVTGLWPGVYVAPLLPILVIGSWLVERLRRG
ncbi:hypothetical protein ACFYOA_15300 [Streptomyces iakyrus]|uniref:hypothetical protein n=1 Tax=Streptomyces iakyrus TaxID=68219 RepID=UPI0036A11482